MNDKHRYSMTVPTVMVKEVRIVDGEPVTTCFCELGGLVYDNMSYEHVVAVERVLADAQEKLVQIVEEVAKAKPAKRGPGG